MIPNMFSGVFNERYWPGVGDVDECWVMADYRCLNAVAGWLSLPSITSYRAAAGNPDDPAHKDGGTIDQSAKAIAHFWPMLHIQAIRQGLLADLVIKVKAGHPASLAVKSSAMPAGQQFGWLDGHSISLYWDGVALRSVNPLAKPHSRGVVITADQLRKATAAFDAKGVWAIVWPTVEEAFKTHPLYRP